MNQDEERKPPPSLGSTPSQPQRPQLQRQILNNKQQILGNLNRKFTGEETTRWLQAMEESPQSAAETIVPGRLVEETQISTPMVLDILFDSIQRYSYELNQSPPEPGLIIQAQRPQGFQERTSFSGNQKIKFMRGHITMREWSMVVYAEETRISVHVLPTDFLMGFSPEQKDFPPYLIMGQERARGGHIWKIESEVIGVDVLPQISRRLLSHLVKVARQEADPQDRFTFRSRQESGEEGVDRSFEQIPESDPGLHPGAQLSSSQLQKDSNMAQTRSQILKNKMAEAGQQEAARLASRPSMAPAAVARPPAPAAPAPAPMPVQAPQAPQASAPVGEPPN
ncbi:MAG: hypothetical protein KC777_29660, partial [Cyanobacteria bacterium HKST-UBA02]|nr:hypothetical protein [Cyanobacteria bacterium HKST-UBA02]